MARAVRAGDVGAVELVQAHLTAIEGAASLNAFVEVYEQEAIEAARRVDVRSPLAGVPVTVKDSFDLAGRRTACGSRLRVEHRASVDAVAVARLRAAGAIVIGKTACPEFLMNWETESHLAPATLNPHNPERTAGGSSGGEAAAIAAWCSAGGIGSDGGGSIRLPAAFCGITGLKPTPGRVPAVGHWPEIAHPGGLLGVAGPMARNIGDLRVLFDVVSGHNAGDPFSIPDAPRQREAKHKKVWVAHDFTTTAEVRSALERAARVCESLGWPVERLPPGLLSGAHDLWRFLFINTNAPLLRAYIEGREQECHWTGLELIDLVKAEPAPSAAELCAVLLDRDWLRARVVGALEREGCVVLAPVCGRTAWRPRERSFDLLEMVRPLTFANLLGLPALAVPVMRGEAGLPLGVQFVGAPWQEDLLLNLGEAFEEEAGTR